MEADDPGSDSSEDERPPRNTGLFCWMESLLTDLIFWSKEATTLDNSRRCDLCVSFGRMVLQVPDKFLYA